MAEKITLNVGDALTVLEITDSTGTVLGTAKLNLFDIRMAARIGEIAEFFKQYKYEGFGSEQLMVLDAALEDKFCYLLGYDCRRSLFGVLSPTTILPDGEMFTMRIIRTISESFSAQVKTRAQERAKLVAQYAQKYQK